ncbi:MAG: DHHA1 domain-containing protein, partial [Kurthia sp.]
RVVQVSDYSIELCGGIHVKRSSEIGFFKIVSEGGIGAGTRRIEAVTGKAAYMAAKEQQHILESAATALKSNMKDVPTRIESLQVELKEAHREMESLNSKLAGAQASDILATAKEFNGVTVLSTIVEAKDNNQLRTLMDDLKSKLEKAVIVLGAVADGKVMLCAGVSKEIAGKEYHAGQIVKSVAEQCGGKGGGRPDMAMAGAKDADKLQAALESVYSTFQ